MAAMSTMMHHVAIYHDSSQDDRFCFDGHIACSAARQAGLQRCPVCSDWHHHVSDDIPWSALVALEEMVDRLTEDHRHARQLADGLAALDGIELDPTRIQTNIVYFKVTQPGWDAARLSQALATTEIRINPTGPNQLRAVTHYQIDAEQVDWTVATVKKLLASK